MENFELVCPLCCGEKFSSRTALKDHIAAVSHGVQCPACQETQSSINDLIIHLESETCTFSKENERLETTVDDQMYNSDNSQKNSEYANENDAKNIKLMKMESTSQDLEYITCDRGQTLNVVSDSDNNILIVSAESDILTNRNIITTQNEDGTISFTQVGAEEMSDCDTNGEHLLEGGVEEEVNVSEEELYTCNTCGVSFTSVVDHIHNYHSEQDVVVEMAESETELGNPDEIQNEVLENRRVITSAGKIITEEQYDRLIIQKDGDGNLNVKEVEGTDDNSVISYKQRFVKINKFWENSQLTVENVAEGSDGLKFENGQAVTKVYGCSKCHVKSTSIQVLETHVCRPNIRQPGEYNCAQCSCTFNNSKSLCAHMKVHKKKINSPGAAKKMHIKLDPNNIFKCDICETVFTTNKSLRLHKRMHDPIKSRPMEGPVSYENLGSETEDTYHCEICDKYIHVGYREIHDEYHHCTAQYHCEICNRKFMSEDYLVMHMNIHNSKTNPIKPEKAELPYSCVFCERRFARPHEKVKHERIHTGEKPHVCEICGKAFRVSYCLTLHMRTHTGERPYQCPHCFKRFKAHSVYNHHLLTHSDKRDYKCPYCPKAFKTSVQLAGHKNSHTKPFSCNECNRPFASLYAVRVHTETHRKLNNLKFACKLCGATYARAFALKDHMKSAHSAKEDTLPHKVEELNTATEPEMITI